ncbi:hypothetical protein EJP82_25620 [Paenibacillus anaericanus]|uniref:Tox-MPTase4 domain-containing protein n=2 Tax=Paenibacillus TaxID=44249 RepID=A0A3S1C0Z2_9BACL|nr:hypothetical protein EJP82_25620 [Paenibacillus anaericanus]
MGDREYREWAKENYDDFAQKLEQTALVEPLGVCVVPDTQNPFEKSFDSFKEIVQDINNIAVELEDKKWDSTYDFFNYLTSGISGGIITAASDRSNKMLNSPYDFINWLAIGIPGGIAGIPDMVKGAFAPEEAFSKEHWLNSFNLAAMFTGGYKSLVKPGGGTLKNSLGSKVNDVIDGTGEGAWYAKKPLNPSDFAGTFDESFAGLGNMKKVELAFKEIENAFGKKYADEIKKLYESTNRGFTQTGDTLGMFKFNPKGEPILDLNKNFGNAKMMANTILHEVKHLRQSVKLGSKEFMALPVEQAEIYATSTNIWQGKRLGLSFEDLQWFQQYYDFFRGQ